ncbi:MAG: hypothetical protein KF794_02055 [Xanthobacteraceae bacterium]|nr:hypothetical protein [Xanthobacteraceae bacterium]QYK45513.1 MAG: hypothetical protein KF794_02055 [Xanthobacteraceae bacterium]
MRNDSGGLRARAVAAVVLVALVAGCSTVESVMGPMGNVFSGSDKPQDPNNPNNPNQPSPNQVAAEENCPGAAIRQGASAWVSNAGTGPNDIRYQASIGTVARECALLGDTMTIKVGVEGRLLVGPKGGPGVVTIPLRIALVVEGPQPRPISSKFYAVQVNVQPGASQTTFTQIEDDLTFPLPPDRNLEKYIIYVGFDPQGLAPQPKAKAKPRAKTAPKKQVKKQAAPPVQQQQQPPGFQPPPQQPQQPRGTPTFDPPPRTN